MCYTELLSDNFEFDSTFDSLVAFYRSLVSTEFLNFLRNDGDVFLVNLDACGYESLSDLSCSYGTVDLTVLADLDSNLYWSCSKFSCESLSIGDELSLFVSALTDVLCEHLLCRLSSESSISLRNKIVDSVTCLNIDDIVCVTKLSHVFFQNDLHLAVLLISKDLLHMEEVQDVLLS